MKAHLCHWRFTILGAGLLAFAGCGHSSPAPAATAPAKVEVYDMRGVIEKLGTASAPRRLMIHHEAAKDMESMTMPFVVDEGVPLTGLAVGDKVAFRFEVDPTSGAEHVTKLEKLPADTVLKLPGSTKTAPATDPMKGMPGM